MFQSEQIDQLATALAKAQGEFKIAEKNGFNPHYKANFSTLVDCVSASRPALSKHGISVSQPIEAWDEKLLLVTKMTHSSGQFMASSVPLTYSGNPQQFGSQLTYLKRYAYCAITGVVSDELDDDAETVVAPTRKSETKQKPQKSEEQNFPPPQERTPPYCEYCLHPLRKSKDKPIWFCSNFKDKSTEHIKPIKDSEIAMFTQKQKTNLLMDSIPNEAPTLDSSDIPAFDSKESFSDVPF